MTPPERCEQAERGQQIGATARQWPHAYPKGALDPRLLDDIVQRVVEAAAPERIILFGSAARGEMGPHSDVDLLVVTETDDAHRLTADIYGNLFGAGAPVEIVVVTPEQVERYRDTHSFVVKPALREGRVVYDAA